MSWIKENKFLAALGGGTLAGVILLYVVGSQGAGRYDTAKAEFDAAVSEAAGYEQGALYPTLPNRDAKRKAIEDYRKSVDSLQGAFQKFRPAEIKNVSPQEFTNRLLAANTDIRAAFQEAGVTVPEPFFVGFEKYKNILASGNSTGVLDYQLGTIKDLMLLLAKAKPAELKNFHRQEQPEESSQTYAAGESVAREFPLEITFVGPEKSVRDFLTAITKAENQYVVIRSLRISNMKKDPPRATDAQFEKPAAKAGDAGPFGGGFVLPGDEPAAAEKPADAAAPKVANSSRILSQVLGNEQLQVFIRLDVLQFLPAKKLP
jgi:hypothetical protein